MMLPATSTDVAGVSCSPMNLVRKRGRVVSVFDFRTHNSPMDSTAVCSLCEVCTHRSVGMVGRWRDVFRVGAGLALPASPNRHSRDPTDQAGACRAVLLGANVAVVNETARRVIVATHPLVTRTMLSPKRQILPCTCRTARGFSLTPVSARFSAPLRRPGGRRWCARCGR